MSENRGRRLIEAGKNILIVLLSCSAIYMGANALVVGGLQGLFQKNDPGRSQVVTQREPSSVAWPVRMAISSWTGESMIRYGVQYDRAVCEEQFQPVASLLREALSGLGVAQEVSEVIWQRVLRQHDSLYFDLLGDIPISVLSGWLSGTENPQEGTVRRLILAAEQKHVLVYYQDTVTQKYYMRVADVVSVEQIHSVTQALMGNGAQFAFEMEGYEGLEGNTLLLPEQPQPKIFAVSNPMDGVSQTEELDQNSNLGKLLMSLSFPDSSYIYSGTDQVIRSGNDTLRISAQGVVRYNAAEGEKSRYIVESQNDQPTAFEVAEACRRLADGAAGELSGEARLYLKEMSRTPNGWQVDFFYCLDGARVQVGEEGYAAHFVVEGTEITQFILQLRCYEQTGEQSIVMPEQQACAAMDAMGKRGSELLLAYRDMGSGNVSAVWTANE